MILYSFYNAPLVKVAEHTNELSLGFVDGCMILAEAKTLTEAQTILKNTMEHTNRAFEWTTSHNSLFELSKLALMNFACTPEDTPPPDLTLSHGTSTQYVNPIMSYKYLGVHVDSKLKWNLHTEKAVASATWWTEQVKWLARSNGGMPSRQL